jgi:Na+/H+ antiporter NhaC
MLYFQKIMKVTEVVDAWTNGLKAIIFTIAFIVLAWAVAGVCKELGTANYIVGLMVAANFPAWALPVSIFIVSIIIAFATGTSWGTMALVMPLALPAAQAIDANMIATLGAVLTGATMGDHCSPISESVVLSSMAASCDHMDHVMTQLPYALTSAAIAIVCGFIPAGLGVPVWISVIVGLVVAWFFIRFVGKRTDGKALGIDEEKLVHESAEEAA